MAVDSVLRFLKEGMELVDLARPYVSQTQSFKDAQALSALIQYQCPRSEKESQAIVGALGRAEDTPLITQATRIFNQCRQQAVPSVK